MEVFRRYFCLFVLGSHIVMLRSYFWICTQTLLLVVLQGPYVGHWTWHGYVQGMTSALPAVLSLWSQEYKTFTLCFKQSGLKNCYWYGFIHKNSSTTIYTRPSTFLHLDLCPHATPFHSLVYWASSWNSLLSLFHLCTCPPHYVYLYGTYGRNNWQVSFPSNFTQHDIFQAHSSSCKIHDFIFQPSSIPSCICTVVSSSKYLCLDIG